MRYHHFCKVNDNCYKKQIDTSSWEHPREKHPTQLQFELFTLIKHTNSHVHLKHLLIMANQPTQRSIKIKCTPLGSPLNFTQMCFQSHFINLVKGQKSYMAVKITHKFTMGK